MSISEYRRMNAQSVLDSIEKDYPQRKLHAKPVKAISGKETSVRGGKFCLPGES